jgi:uncharacterized protein GlcG (DUF336 family)
MSYQAKGEQFSQGETERKHYMASWLRKLISRSPRVELRREPDSARDERLGGIQQLETRLCLGGFAAPPSFELDVPQSYDTVEFAETEISRLGDDSLISEMNAFKIDLSNLNPEATDAPAVRETASLENPSSTDSERPLQLLQPQLVSQISGNALSEDLTRTPQHILENSRTPTKVTSGLSQSFGGLRPNLTPPSVTAGSPASSSFNSGIVGVRTGSTQVDSSSRVNSDQLAAYGVETGQTETVVEETPSENQILPWIDNDENPIIVKYDFRSVNGFQNQITQEQQELAVQALSAWSNATQGMLEFEQDTQAGESQIINMGVGNLAAFGYVSGAGGTMSVGGGAMTTQSDSAPVLGGVVWLDQDENWDTIIGNGNPEGTRDFFTVVAHETGHALGMDHTADSRGVMSHAYPGELTTLSPEDVGYRSALYSVIDVSPADSPKYRVQPMGMGDPQLKATEIEQILDRASAATSSQNAIITIVDRAGTILGVRVEDGVTAPNDAVLSFMIDGAVSKARTAAFFSNGDPSNGTATPLTSRTVRFLSQSTITQREVEANPNSSDPTLQGPGFVAPIGLGGHFAPEIMHTPPVDLFAIEHTNRDSIVHPGVDGVRDFSFGAGGITDIVSGGDDVVLAGRFDIDVTNSAIVPAGQDAALIAPESYGFISGRAPTQQSRGVATLPGGLPIFRDSNGDGFGDTLVGGIGVFFPGTDGYATFEQGFIPGIGQTEAQRTNAAKVLESEYIAFAALGGSLGAELLGSPGAIIGNIAGVARAADIDLPFGRLDLVGITLEILGPIPGTLGVNTIVQTGNALGPGIVNGTDQPVDFGADNVANNGDEALYRDGTAVPSGWLVTPQDSAVDPDLTAARVRQLISQGVGGALAVRAAVRLPFGNRTRMVLAVADSSGEVLGLFRMQDATVFSIDVAVAKSRNTAYYADATALQSVDQVVAAGTAFSNRTFRFLAEPRFPSGVDGSTPPVFSILNNPNINPVTAENLGGPAAASSFTTVLGYNSFNPNTNFRDPSNIEHQNGVVFFPGSTPVYFGSQLIGGYGISGDGVDQDDVVTFIGAQGFLPPVGEITRADQTFVNGVRLPYIKFLRNPFG